MKSASRSRVKIRIAPSSLNLHRYTALFFLLSLLLFSSIPSEAYYSLDETQSSDNIDSILRSEKIELLVGKNDSLIASLSLNGGNMDTPLTLPAYILDRLNSISLLYSNQSAVLDVWTNPLWKYPNGLIIKLNVASRAYETLHTIVSTIKTVFFEYYQVNVSIYNIKQISTFETELSLVTQIDFDLQKTLFETIFERINSSEVGNFIDVFHNHFQVIPLVYAFGYTITFRDSKVFTLYRKAMLSLKNQIEVKETERTLSTESVLGSSLISNSNALYSTFAIRFPFHANFTEVSPKPNNVAPEITGTFEWLLKTPFNSFYTSFDTTISYFLSSDSIPFYPRVVISNSYSDDLLNNDGILRMDYSAKNIGTASALNTSLRVPIPSDLEHIIQENITLPILDNQLTINETFESLIEIELDIPPSVDEITPILKIGGWYQNISTSSLARWESVNSLSLHENYVSVECSNGMPLDLYNIIINQIIPYIEEKNYADVNEFLEDLDIIFENLRIAVINTFNQTFSAFYRMKSFFNFESSDFEFVSSPLGNYLAALIPNLSINSTSQLNWIINNIPTEQDEFGAMFYSTQYNIDNEQYFVFETKKSDYQSLMITNFVQNNISGRFLSSYNTLNDSFLSLGTRFSYSDNNNRDYYGFTNGINLQIGDDEAVLKSTLNVEESVYRVGDTINLNFSIQNRGSLTAYDVKVNIVNLKLNYLWQPIELIKVKTFRIDSIAAGENLWQSFKIRANSYIGLNTYIALIDFVSDKDQDPVVVTNPWSNETIVWDYGGETRNVISSTMSAGLLLPPISLTEKPRSSFPLPEVDISLQYKIGDDNTSLSVEYQISNIGLSETNITVSQILDDIPFSHLESLSCTYNGDVMEINITSDNLSNKLTFVEQLLFSPNDVLIIEEEFTNLEDILFLPPLKIDYSSSYQILSTDFENIDEQQFLPPVINSENVKLSFSSIIESDQNKFDWTTFSNSIEVQIPSVSTERDPITLQFPDIPILYHLTLIGVSTLIIGFSTIIVLIVRKKKER